LGSLVSAYEFYRSSGTVDATPGAPPDPRFLDTFETFVFDYVLPNSAVLNTLDDAIREQNIFINDREGACLVNFLGRYEKLDEFQARLLHDGIIGTPIGHHNVSPGKSTRDYRSYFGKPELIDAVARVYARDIAQFAYRFG